jgi:hypothetical protein
MPIKSMAQLRAMYAAAADGESGIPKRVAKKYIKETPKSVIRDLPERVAPKKKRSR